MMAVLPPRRNVIITWPAHGGHGWRVDVADALTGQDISSMVLSVNVLVEPKGGIEAELLMITDAQGNPSNQATLLPDGSGYHMGSFRCGVAGMRVKE